MSPHFTEPTYLCSDPVTHCSVPILAGGWTSVLCSPFCSSGSWPLLLPRSHTPAPQDIGAWLIRGGWFPGAVTEPGRRKLLSQPGSWWERTGNVLEHAKPSITVCPVAWPFRLSGEAPTACWALAWLALPSHLCCP